MKNVSNNVIKWLQWDVLHDPIKIYIKHCKTIKEKRGKVQEKEEEEKGKKEGKKEEKGRKKQGEKIGGKGDEGRGVAAKEEGGDKDKRWGEKRRGR